MIPLAINGYESHPAANLFPMLDDAELAELTADIKANGLLDPIVMHEGKILDGRNRMAACARAGVAPQMVQWRGLGSPTQWVLSKNIHRRHLTAGQKAMIAERSLPLFEAEAKARLKTSTGGPTPRPTERIPEAGKGESREQAAASVGVNPRYVSDAKRIRTERPDLAEKVERGETTIPAAIREIKKPEQPQPKPRPHHADSEHVHDWINDIDVLTARVKSLGKTRYLLEQELERVPHYRGDVSNHAALLGKHVLELVQPLLVKDAPELRLIDREASA